MSGEIVCLTGGVGGAKLVLGLDRVLRDGALTVGVNTGDDFEHLSLSVWPDFDTTLYTLAGLSDTERGWGRAGETWAFMGALKQLGGPGWFNLGDKDLALNVWRSDALRRGVPPAEIAAHLTGALGLSTTLIPATRDRLRTVLDTDEGELDFQTYFVARRAAPKITAIRFVGQDEARPDPALMEALAAPTLQGVIIAPSNPYLSLGPILALPGLRQALRECPAPVIAVSPIVGGEAIKGPTAKIMGELGLDVSPLAVAAGYRDFLTGFVLDEVDAALQPQIEAMGLACAVAQTVMRSEADKIALAKAVVEFLECFIPLPDEYYVRF